MYWTDRIRRGRINTENTAGCSPRYLIVKQEVWEALRLEMVVYDIFDFDGMIVAVTDNLINPFEFAFGEGDVVSIV